MEDKFFDIDEAMINYGEMTSFDFNSGSYLACNAQKEAGEYAYQPYTFKYGNFDVVDMLKSMFCKTSLQKINQGGKIMANLYENFENRFTYKWFASDWSEVAVKQQDTQDFHKDLATLQNELYELEEKMEGISLKQLRLANLAKLYNQ